MKILPWALAVALLAGVGEARAQAPDQVVFVHGRGEESAGGRGITRRRGDDCFVVTPDHVVRGDTVRNPNFRSAPHLVRIVASKGRPIETTFVDRLEGDLAILHVDPTSPYASTLCATWPRRIWTTQQLHSMRGSEREGQLVGVNDAGGDDPMEITLDDVDPATRRFSIRPKRNGEPFTAGISGSLVFVNGRAVGIVKEVIGDGTIAAVQSLEAAAEKLDSYFETEFPPSRALIRTSLLIPGRGQFATRRGEIGVAWFVATLATSTYLFTRSEVVDRTEVVDDDFGIPRSYPYQEREFPLQWYAAATWVVSGVLSTWEAGQYVRTGYGHGKHDTPPPTSLRIGAYPAVVAGERAVVVGAGFSF
jgi:hypothetical protein